MKYIGGIVIGLVAWAGCGEKAPAPKQKQESGTQTAASAEATGSTNLLMSNPSLAGKIEGVVSLAAGETLPHYAREDMLVSPWPPKVERIPQHCKAQEILAGTTVTLGAARQLGGVMVALSDFSTPVKLDPKTHKVFIRDCRLQPALIVATVGDTLIIENQSGLTLFPRRGRDPVLKTLSHGQKRVVQLDKPTVTPITCGMSAPCGRADLVVLRHPLHAVTNAHGEFLIEHVPVEHKRITLNAWHPLFQESNQTLTLDKQAFARIQIDLKPRTQVEQKAKSETKPKKMRPKKPAASPTANNPI